MLVIDIWDIHQSHSLATSSVLWKVCVVLSPIWMEWRRADRINSSIPMVCNLLQDDWVRWIWTVCNYEESIPSFFICASFQSIHYCCFSLRNEISTAMYIGSIQTENYISIPVVDQDWIVWIRINVILQRWKSNDVLIFCNLDRHFVRQVIFHVQTFYAIHVSFEAEPLSRSLTPHRSPREDET